MSKAAQRPNPKSYRRDEPWKTDADKEWRSKHPEIENHQQHVNYALDQLAGEALIRKHKELHEKSIESPITKEGEQHDEVDPRRTTYPWAKRNN